jgi:hypothetical protein
MIAIGKRKKLNIRKAVHADKLWDWECRAPDGQVDILGPVVNYFEGCT